MDKKKDVLKQDYYTIDVIHVAKYFWHRIWILVLAAMIAAVAGFSVAAFGITPTYSSSILLYVNNSSISLGNTSFSITSSEIDAAQSLVKTYGEILNNRTTLERVIEKSEVPYSYKQLSGMINAAPSNETEIMKVTVTAEDPYVAAKIANCIAEVLPVRISEIIDGASMEVVDAAVPNISKIGPNVTKYTAVGIVLGILLASVVLLVFALIDDTIHDEDYLARNYSYPILAKIPNLAAGDQGRKYSHYGYYYQQKPTGKK